MASPVLARLGCGTAPWHAGRPALASSLSLLCLLLLLSPLRPIVQGRTSHTYAEWLTGSSDARYAELPRRRPHETTETNETCVGCTSVGIQAGSLLREPASCSL